MGIVLSDWVAQGKLRPVYILCPVLSTPSPIDPALVVFGLKNVNSRWMNQQGINLSSRAIFFENIEIVQNLFIAIELVQDLTKLVLSLFSLVVFEFPRGSLSLLEIVRLLALAGRPIQVCIFSVLK